MSQQRYRKTVQEDEERIESLTNEFYFIIYHTYTGNRKTLAIYRNEDGELKEVNFILNFKPQKDIGQKTPDFHQKLELASDKWYESHGFIAPRKHNWCQTCDKPKEECVCHVGKMKAFDDESEDDICCNLLCGCDSPKAPDARKGRR